MITEKLCYCVLNKMEISQVSLSFMKGHNACILSPQTQEKSTLNRQKTKFSKAAFLNLETI